MNDHDLLERVAAGAPVPGPGYAGHVLSTARRARSRRRAAGVGATLAAVILSVGGTTVVVRAAIDGSPVAPPPATAPPPTQVTSPSPESGAYAAALRALADEVRQDSRPLPILYILAFTCANVVTPTSGECAPQPLPLAWQDEIAAALRTYAPVEFVTDRRKVTGPDLVVVNGGVLATLGRIRLDGDRAEVPLSVQQAGLNGRGLTYTLGRQGDTWRVTGTVGPGWIS